MRTFLLVSVLALGAVAGCADHHPENQANPVDQQSGRYHPMTDDTGQYHTADTGIHTTAPQMNRDQH